MRWDETHFCWIRYNIMSIGTIARKHNNTVQQTLKAIPFMLKWIN